jgi:prepilin-type N-terminal cleavage/methylation domain-containing protein
MFLRHRNRAFSLIELVIVVVIIGIIAAIAIPRMSRGSAGASDSTLIANLRVLRNAIDLFATEHNGTFPAVATFNAQLTTYTDASGNANASKTSTYLYGPYIRTIPTLPVGARRGSSGVAAADAAGIGWIYNATTGAINANTTTETDSAGTLYSNY